MIIDSMLRDLSMAHTARRAAALALGLCLVGGCAVGQESGAEAVEEGLAPIASLHLANGAEVHFYEPEEGRVLGFTRGDIPESLERLPPVALYEALSREAAPPALIAAQQRMDAGRLARGPRRAATEPDVIEASAPTPQAGAGEALGSAAQALTASDFVDDWCDVSGLDINFCWTDRTDYHWEELKGVKWFHAHVDSTSGTVELRVHYKNFSGDWVLTFAQTVTETGGVISYETEDNDTYRVAVAQVDAGNSYHLSIHGDK
ncbi:hypothetical protein [Sorangium sp. So ce1153]|uniref:hypothetical protein n=1 Tax=Sorangium sp. So ce1153 TaxID=3133333 RepID=UPI003F62B887